MKKLNLITLALSAVFLFSTISVQASFPVKKATSTDPEVTVVKSENSKEVTYDFSQKSEKKSDEKINSSKPAKETAIAKVKKTMGDGSGFAIAGFVISLVSLFIASIILAPIAIVFSVLGLKSSRKGLAIAGLVIGIISLVLGIIILAAFIAAAGK